MDFKCSILAPAFTRSASKSVIAAMDSTTTTALGTMTGSCLPLMEMVISSPSLLTVSCWEKMEGVGFIWARRRICEPSLMPPSIPPAWLVDLRTLPFCMRKASLFSEPRREDTSTPSPISTALTAPMDITALARFASSFSKTGSPRPAGTPSITHSITPPEES